MGSKKKKILITGNKKRIKGYIQINSHNYRHIFLVYVDGQQKAS